MTLHPGLKLGWKPGCHVAVLRGDGVYLLGERGSVVLRGAAYERIAPLLDGTRTADELVERLSSTTPAAEVYYSLGQLIARGHVCEGAPAGSVEEAGFWSSLGLDASTVAERLRAVAVAVVTVGAVDATGITAALGSVGVRVSAVEEGGLALVVTDDYLQPGLAGFNARALETGRPWLLCKPTGSVVWVGPLFRPGLSACWECLAQRLRWQRPDEAYVQARTGGAALVLPRSALPGSEGMALTLAALQVAKAVGADTAAGSENMVVTLDLSTTATRQHVVVRRPQCARCGHPLDPGRAPLPPRLRSEATWFTADGGYRTVAPETTFARYQHHISPITGLVGELRPVAIPADVAPLLHVYRGGSLSLPVDTPDLLRQVLRSRSAGKGATEAQAVASGLCESLERYSGTFQGDEPRVRATHRSLGDRAIHPNACMLFSEQQYATAERWSLGAAPYSAVPAPFDEDQQIDWSPAWSLTGQSFKYVPTSYGYYGFPRQDEVRHNPPDSNGCAAGNTLEEAILQGWLELVERDSVALWWYNRVQRPGVDLESFDDPYIAGLRQAYERLDREVWALDLTADLGVPTFAALSRRVNEGAEAIIFGFGAHFDARVGLLRALTEMNQSLPAVLPGAMSPETGRVHAPDARRWWQTATLNRERHLTPAPTAPHKKGDFAAERVEDLWHYVLRCQALAEQHHLEVLVLDQTRPDVGLPVVRVIVPGLRHFWARFAPGRLFDVPVGLGWLPAPRSEDELNPVAMFL